MRIYLGTGLSALLRLALLGHVCHSVSAATPWLEPELRISASSITDPDTFGCLMENADLDKVQSLDIRVGARPGRPEYIAPFDEAFAPVRVSVREYYETKLPQLAAAASELIARMPGLTAFRWYGEDVPLDVVKTLQDTCRELRNISWMIRARYDDGPAMFKNWPREPLLPGVEPGVRLATPRELAAFANLTSFSMQRRNPVVGDWVGTLLALAERSPQLQHLSLSRDLHEWYGIEPLSVEELSNKYRDAGGNPFSSLQGLHLREGFQFLPLTTLADSKAVDTEEQQHPAPYLEQLVDMSALTAISISLHREEENARVEIPSDYFRPVAWALLDPQWLPRLQSLWLSCVSREANRYLRDGIDAVWLSNIDIAVGSIYRGHRQYESDYMVDAFDAGRHPGTPSRRVRSIVIPELRGRDMETAERYGEVQHLAATLGSDPPSAQELRSFFQLRGLETIQLMDDESNLQPKRTIEQIIEFAEGLAAACPKLWYIRINVVLHGRWHGGLAWNVRRREDGSPVLERITTREKVNNRPAIYDAVVDQWAERWGFVDHHITCPSRGQKSEAKLSAVRDGSGREMQLPLGG